MKALIIIFAILLILGGAGVGIYYTLKPLPMERPDPTLTAIADSLHTVLPTDPKAAQKEIQRVHKAYAALQPKTAYIVIDTHSNHLTYRTEDTVLFRATCSTGSGGILVDSATHRKWTFNTPRGVFKVGRKIENPWWRKPDWEFIQNNEAIPKKESDRMDPNVLGDYALAMGDGYFIHGTLYKRLLGISVTHGCVRLGDDDLKTLYKKVDIGTPIYIY